jgi:hypothetical protein
LFSNQTAYSENELESSVVNIEEPTDGRASDAIETTKYRKANQITNFWVVIV